MIELTSVPPLFINAGLKYPLTVPYLDALGEVGGDPRNGDAVPLAQDLFIRGQEIGRFLSWSSDLLILGECVPGGTTTALCVLRAFGYQAAVSSSYIQNPVSLKEKLCREIVRDISSCGSSDPLGIIRYAGDPMIPVAAGIATSYTGSLVLAGGTQMLAVCSLIKAMNKRLPLLVTTSYVRDDRSANFEELARTIGVSAYYVDPEFGQSGHAGLARYCEGEVKEGTGAGGAMFLAYLMGFTPSQIQNKIFETVQGYS